MEFLDTSLDEVYLSCSDSSAIPGSTLQLEWRLDFPVQTQEASRVPLRNLRIPQQLKKNHEVPPSSRDEALSQCSISRKIPRFLLKFEMVPDTLDATQKVPQHTGLTQEEHGFSQQHLI